MRTLSPAGVCLVLGGIVLAAYSSAFQAGFAVDSRFIIQQDPRIREASAENLKLVFTHDYWYPTHVSQVYRPLTTLSFMLDYAVLGHGERPAGYHLANLLIHWTNVLLLYLLMRRLSFDQGPAFFAAVLFAVHPVATEAVTNIVGRADLLATASVLGGTLIYAHASERNGTSRAVWLCALGLTAAVGLFAKESAVALVGGILLYDVAVGASASSRDGTGGSARSASSVLAGYASLAPVFVLLVLARTYLLGSLSLVPAARLDNPIVGAGFLPGRLTAVKVLGSDLRLFLWPAKLSCDYSYDQVPLVRWPLASWEDWKAVLALAVLAAILIVAAMCHRRGRAVFFLVAFPFVTIFPVSNLMVTIGSIQAERFLYLPLAGFAACVSVAVFAASRRILPPRRAVAPVVLALIATALGIRTFVRNLDWKDNATIWSKAVEAAPHSFKGHQNLALALFTEVYPRSGSTEVLDRAIREAELSLSIVPDNLEMLMSLAGFYLARGDTLAGLPAGAPSMPRESRALYEKAVSVLLHARVLDEAARGDGNRAEIPQGVVAPGTRSEEMRRRTTANPARAEPTGVSASELSARGTPGIYGNLGSAYRRLSRNDEALDAFLTLARVAPDVPDAWLSVGDTYAARGEMEKAAVAFTQVLLLDPANVDAQNLLPEVYRKADPGGCSVVTVEGRPRVNRECPLVRNTRCGAWKGLIESYDRAKRVDQALEARTLVRQEGACEVERGEPAQPKLPR